MTTLDRLFAFAETPNIGLMIPALVFLTTFLQSSAPVVLAYTTLPSTLMPILGPYLEVLF